MKPRFDAYRRESVVSYPEHHFDTVDQLIAELSRTGWLLREIEPGLQYGIIEYKDGDDFVPEMLDIRKDAEVNKRRLVFFFNDLKYSHDTAYYPFPLCFRDPDRFLDVLGNKPAREGAPG